MPTKIEWCQESWNPVTGCTKISAGCQNCYAERMAKRLAGRCGYPADDPFRVTLHPDRIEQPLKWKKSRRIFVCSMGDLFHEAVSFDDIGALFKTMCHPLALKHTFLILTKRPDRMAEFFEQAKQKPWGHIWLGVTAENQEQADKRIPILLSIPAAVRLVSIEPMLAPVKLWGAGCRWCFNTGLNPATGAMCPQCGIDWVIVGGESGPGARPMHPDWARKVRDDCVCAGVPFFFKQWGEWAEMGDDSGIRRAGDFGWAGKNKCIVEYQNSFPGRMSTDAKRVNYTIVNEEYLYRVGKKAAGRELDGRTWDEYPE